MHRLIYPASTKIKLTLGTLLLTASAMLLSGCADSFANSLRRHPYCADRAGVMRFKVDDCIERTHGRREDFNECLANSGVPEGRIARLDQCVESAQNQPY